MKDQNFKHIIWLMVLIPFMSCTNPSSSETEKWIQLFNGRDLTGWDIKISGYELNENYKNTFRVEDSLLTVSYDEYDTFNYEFGHLFYNQSFSHYRLRSEYRFIGQQVSNGPGWAFRNNGFMLHCQSAQSMGLDQDFPISIEAQILGGGDEGERSTMNLCTPGTHVVMGDSLVEDHCINSTSQTFRGDQWVTAEMVVLGDSVIHHLVNGDTVMTYFKPEIGGGVVSGFDSTLKVDGTPLKEGYIAIQAESHPTQFRKIELLDLSGDYQ